MVAIMDFLAMTFMKLQPGRPKRGRQIHAEQTKFPIFISISYKRYKHGQLLQGPVNAVMRIPIWYIPTIFMQLEWPRRKCVGQHSEEISLSTFTERREM